VRNRAGARRGAMSGHGPRAGCPGASRSKETMLFIGEKRNIIFFIE
jgi:hypothetical protein